MTQQPDLNQLSTDQLRASTAELMATLAAKDRALVNSHALNDKLTLELAILKRHKYARRSEQSNALQSLLLGELVDSDLAAIEVELEQAISANGQTTKPKRQPKRTPLPPELPRTLIHHEPDNTQCRCGCQLKRIGEDVSEKPDYVPGEFSVEGKWACDNCETLIQAPVPAQIIDKGSPTSWLMAQALEYIKHLYEVEWQTKDLPPDKRQAI